MGRLLLNCISLVGAQRRRYRVGRLAKKTVHRAVATGSGGWRKRRSTAPWLQGREVGEKDGPQRRGYSAGTLAKVTAHRAGATVSLYGPGRMDRFPPCPHNPPNPSTSPPMHPGFFFRAWRLFAGVLFFFPARLRILFPWPSAPGVRRACPNARRRLRQSRHAHLRARVGFLPSRATMFSPRVGTDPAHNGTFPAHGKMPDGPRRDHSSAPWNHSSARCPRSSSRGQRSNARVQQSNARKNLPHARSKERNAPPAVILLRRTTAEILDRYTTPTSPSNTPQPQP